MPKTSRHLKGWYVCPGARHQKGVCVELPHLKQIRKEFEGGKIWNF